MIGIITAALSVIVLFCAARNEWVYRKQLEFITDWGYESFDALPSYSEMMLKFWVWDITKFIKD